MTPNNKVDLVKISLGAAQVIALADHLEKPAGAASAQLRWPEQFGAYAVNVVPLLKVVRIDAEP